MAREVKGAPQFVGGAILDAMSKSAALFEQIRKDTTSGSSEILSRTIEWMETSLQEGSGARDIVENLGDLCHLHSAMASIQNLHAFFEKIPLNLPRLKSWRQMYEKHEESACKRFAAYLSNFKNLLVHSNSGMLARSLISVTTPLNIFCTESRPALEGKVLAEKLAESHHRVYLITDLAAFTILPRVEILAFGCDAFTPRGVVNKIGTHALAAAAGRDGKKNYFVATSEKKLDHWKPELLFKQGNREEIYRGKEKVRVENYYFDLTPAELVDKIFLEEGATGRF